MDLNPDRPLTFCFQAGPTRGHFRHLKYQNRGIFVLKASSATTSHSLSLSFFCSISISISTLSTLQSKERQRKECRQDQRSRVHGLFRLIRSNGRGFSISSRLLLLSLPLSLSLISVSLLQSILIDRSSLRTAFIFLSVRVFPSKKKP